MQDKLRRQLAAIMFMDIVGYSALVQRSEAQALEFVRIHKDLLEQYAKKHSGSVMNYYGDASLTMFSSAIEAVKCGTELQRLFHNEYNLPMRMGIHLGEVVLENETIYGNGVNIASRLESMGVAGSVLISGAVYTELENQDELNASHIGAFKFKNITNPVEVYAIKDPQLVLPEAKDLKSDKSHILSVINLKSLILGLVILAGFMFSNRLLDLFKNHSDEILVERLSVPSFKNFTGNQDYNFIGDMAAHRITKELFEIEGATVVDFQTQNEIKRIRYASIIDPELEYASQSGAINIMEGNIQQYSRDTLMFSVLIKRLSSGEILKSFPNVKFAANNPIDGVIKLSEYIHGYWEVRDKKLLSFPKLEAYKLYVKAKNNWSGDDDLTEKYILEGLKIDPDFFDLYNLLLIHYYNTDEYEKALDVIANLQDKKSSMTARQRNMLTMKNAYFTGNYIKAFESYKEEFQLNTKDLFVNTGFMAVSNELVHKYDQSLDAFKQIDFNLLNIEECGYCETRLRIGLVAAMSEGDNKLSRDIIVAFPRGYKNMRSNVLQFRYYSKQKDFNKIDEIISQVLSDSILSDAWRVKYYAARELFVTENFEASKKLSIEHIQDNENRMHSSLAWAHYFSENYEKSKEVLTALLNENENSLSNLGLLGVVEARLGNNETAEQIIARISELDELRFGSISYNKSRIYLHMGLKEKALDHLAKSIEEGAMFFSSNVFENDPVFADIKRDPDFLEIIFPYSS